MPTLTINAWNCTPDLGLEPIRMVITSKPTWTILLIRRVIVSLSLLWCNLVEQISDVLYYHVYHVAEGRKDY
jgi:hypothetical protein